MGKRMCYKVFVFFFFFACGFISGMEHNKTLDKGSHSGEKKKKAHLGIPIPSSGVGTSSHSSRSAEKSSRAAGKKTPRTFEDLDAIIKRKSQKSSLLKTSRLGTAPAISLHSQPKTDDDFADISPEDIMANVERFAEQLHGQIYIDPALMAEAALRVHKENDKSPLHEEKKGYAKACRNDEDYDVLAQELLKRMVLMHMGAEDLPPSEKIVDTHVGILRKTVNDKNVVIFWTRVLAGVKFCWAVGSTIWAIYKTVNQSAGGCPVVNGTMV